MVSPALGGDNYEAWDEWYNKYIAKHVKPLEDIPGIKLDIRDQGFEIGD